MATAGADELRAENLVCLHEAWGQPWDHGGKGHQGQFLSHRCTWHICRPGTAVPGILIACKAALMTFENEPGAAGRDSMLCSDKHRQGSCGGGSAFLTLQLQEGECGLHRIGMHPNGDGAGGGRAVAPGSPAVGSDGMRGYRPRVGLVRAGVGTLDPLSGASAEPGREGVKQAVSCRKLLHQRSSSHCPASGGPGCAR